MYFKYHCTVNNTIHVHVYITYLSTNTIQFMILFVLEFSIIFHMLYKKLNEVLVVVAEALGLEIIHAENNSFGVLFLPSYQCLGGSIVVYVGLSKLICIQLC